MIKFIAHVWILPSKGILPYQGGKVHLVLVYRWFYSVKIDSYFESAVDKSTY